VKYEIKMNEQQVLSAITSFNVWWRGLPVPATIKKSNNKRKVFYDLAKNCLEDNKITSISGPRQVGKTTLMGQLIDHQIVEKKIDPKRVLYFAADNELLKLNSENVLIDCLKVYFDYVLGEAPEALKSKVYLYLDEIQSLENWAKQIKSYYDTYPLIKFVLSGSSHTKLYTDAAESLVGRINFRLVLPFKFREFLEFNMQKLSQPLKFAPVILREALKQSVKIENPTLFYSAATKLQIDIATEVPQIKKLLDVYLIKGGYPGLLEFGENYDKASERLHTDLELTVYKDIHQIFKTRNTSDLMSLLTLVASSSGQKINHSRLSQVIGIDRRVVAEYLSYTKLLYLTSESQFYKGSKYKQVEKMNKAYLVDVGHRNMLLGKMTSELLSESEIGLVIQTVVYNHASRLKFFLSNKSHYDIYYWEDGNSEVDLILDLPIFVLPIEVKSKSGDKALAAIYKFMDQNEKSKWGIIITKDELRIDGKIIFIPAWLFLMIC
jgi:predicted AAA+ superfamily ATPase